MELGVNGPALTTNKHDEDGNDNLEPTTIKLMSMRNLGRIATYGYLHVRA
jgi:hypothetical protein